MLTATLVYATVEGFPAPSLPKHAFKADYAAIKEVNQLLTANIVSVESNLGRGQNEYLGLILLPKQYVCIYGTAFVRPPARPRKNVKRPGMEAARRIEAHPK